MPTYVYECPVHGEFEVEQKITDPKLWGCPKEIKDWLVPWRTATCGEPVERLIAGGTSFVLKGSGWAKDGYK